VGSLIILWWVVWGHQGGVVALMGCLILGDTRYFG
jgi:hypothetical protein